ncbi:MAG: DUF692 domain-containing protein [Rhodoferax sp.]|nr:DUF692 domain-containing protein [Rhodoferax sp.]
MFCADPDLPRADLTQVGIGWRHPHYGELLATRPDLAFLEVHSENFFAEGGAALEVLRQGRAQYPVSLHGVGLSLGSAVGVDEWHLDQLQRLVAQIEPVRVSDHACFARGHIHTPGGLQPVHASDLLPVPFSSEALDVMCANVQRVQDRLKRPISVENLSAYIAWQSSNMGEPEFLASLAHRTGCGLLVDVNNIYVNALNDRLQGVAGDPVQRCTDWLDAIPAAAVTEMHLAGHADCGDIVIDDHGSRVCDPVWSVYRHAVSRFGAVPTLIEWDTDVPALDVLLGEAAKARQLCREVLA